MLRENGALDQLKCAQQVSDLERCSAGVTKDLIWKYKDAQA